MKTAIALLALAIAAAAPAAADPNLLRLTPPKEYDRPYKGWLTVVEAENQQEVRKLCPTSVFSPQLGALGCAYVNIEEGWCRVILAPDADITATGFPPELIKRHEIAHCNGWPADHRGARIENWASAPLQYAASQFDEFAFNAVRKTVGEVAKNLARDDKRAATRFVVAAKGIGLTPESKLTGEVLSDPAAAAPLAKAVGIGTELSYEQWLRAHALALQASRARQAAAAAANQSVPPPGQAAPQPQPAQPAPPGAAPQ